MLNDKKFKEKLLLITYGIVLFVLLINYTWILNVIKFLGKAIFPFVIGFIIAFILNVLIKTIEDKLLKKIKKFKRAISITMSLLIVLGFIVFLLAILIPQLHNAGNIFLDNIPEYQENLYSLGEKIGLSHEQLEFLDLNNNKLKDNAVTFIKNNSDQIIGISMGFASSLVSGITSFFVGLIFAIYLLMDKERLCQQMKKLFRTVSGKKIYDKTAEVLDLSNVTFSNFVKVQVFEAFVLGILCFLGMLLFRLPYAATISVLIGVTALLPIFGAFIGCALGAFLIFMIDPFKAVTFIIFFLVLQQIEGNFIYPKVVGNKIGLPSIWVLVAVTIGGTVGGIFGMLLGVPIVSIIYSLLRIYVNNHATTDKLEGNR